MDTVRFADVQPQAVSTYGVLMYFGESYSQRQRRSDTGIDYPAVTH